MCNQCNNPNHIDFAAELEAYQEKLSELDRLSSVQEKLSDRDRNFASDLLSTFSTTHALSAKQWDWVTRLADRVTDLEPVYGNFKAIRVAFMLAGDKLKVPKVRLISPEGRFVQLNFFKAGTSDGYRQYDKDTIKVFVDGWQGHGYRKYAGEISDEFIRPFRKDRMTDDVKDVIQNLAMDPLGVAKAMAELLGVCMYCGQRLSDPESKRRGYGSQCADNYGLPWGKKRVDAEKNIEEHRAAALARLTA